MKVLKWIGIIVGVLLVIVVLAVGFGYLRGSSLLTKSYDYELTTFPIPDDPESIANGEYLARGLVGCVGCHGEDFSGQVLVDEPGFITLYSKNLTSGEGGVGADYSDEDWIRSLRHGIRPNGETLLVMPSQYITRLGGEDVADIIAYLKSLPPVDNVTPERKVGFMPRLLVGLGAMPPETVAEIMPATGIDHNAPIPDMPEKAVTAEWGSYRALICRACHGEDLAGKPADPQSGAPAHPNLTPGGELLTWDEAGFVNFIRTGVTPSGREVDPEMMPWPEFKNASDDDLKAIWAFLSGLEALESNN